MCACMCVPGHCMHMEAKRQLAELLRLCLKKNKTKAKTKATKKWREKTANKQFLFSVKGVSHFTTPSVCSIFFNFKNIFNITNWGHCWFPHVPLIKANWMRGWRSGSEVRISCYSYRSPEGSTHNHLQLHFRGIWCPLSSFGFRGNPHVCAYIYIT